MHSIPLLSLNSCQRTVHYSIISVGADRCNSICRACAIRFCSSASDGERGLLTDRLTHIVEMHVRNAGWCEVNRWKSVWCSVTWTIGDTAKHDSNKLWQTTNIRITTVNTVTILSSSHCYHVSGNGWNGAHRRVKVNYVLYRQGFKFLMLLPCELTGLVPLVCDIQNPGWLQYFVLARLECRLLISLMPPLVSWKKNYMDVLTRLEMLFFIRGFFKESLVLLG